MIFTLNLAIFSTCLALVPFALIAINFKRVDLAIKVLAVLFINSLVFDFVGFYLLNKQHYNVGLFNVFTFVEMTLYGLFYNLILKDYAHAKIIRLSLLFILIITVILTFNDKFNNELNQITLTIESITYIALSLLYFDVMLTRMDYDKVWNNPYFWINAAILVYFAGSFFVFIFSNILKIETEVHLWNVHSFVRILSTVIITIGIWKSRKI